MAKMYNRAGVACATTGTGTVTLGSAIASGVAINSCSFQTFGTSGVANAEVVSYLILDNNGAWEYGTGTYTSAGTTLSRTLGQSSTGALLNLSGSAQVFITARKEDIQSASETQTANTVWAGPTSGGAAAPTFRAVVAADIATASPVPTRQYLTSGTAATYTTPSGCRAIFVRVIGGGGGGGASATNAGTTGTTSTFNSVNAVGGTGGGAGTAGVGVGGAGGTGGSGTATKRWPGSAGASAGGNISGFPPGGAGAPGLFGMGAGVGGGAAASGSVGGAAGANTGAGGGGGGGNQNSANGGGGGSGEYFELNITTPAATYTYTVGGGGAGGTAGTRAGGAGGSGMIIVDEYY